MQEFKVPELGENIAQGDVTRVLVKVGDTIEKEQPVVELETDKATIEVPSSVAGTVKEIKVKPGEKVKVGSVILTVDDASTSQRTGNGAGGASAKQDDQQEKQEEQPQEQAEQPEEKAAELQNLSDVHYRLEND